MGKGEIGHENVAGPAPLRGAGDKTVPPSHRNFDDLNELIS